MRKRGFHTHLRVLVEELEGSGGREEGVKGDQDVPACAPMEGVFEVKGKAQKDYSRVGMGRTG